MQTSTTILHHALRGAETHRVRDVVDWLERPWAPDRNDALRACWHAARRDRAAQPALADAIVAEVAMLGSMGARDVAFVARRLDLACATLDGIAYEIVRRLGGPIGIAPRPVPDVVVSAVEAALDVARIVLRDAEHARPRSHRGHRRHRRGL